MEIKVNRLSLGDMPIYEKYMRSCTFPSNIWTANFPYLWAVSQSRYKKVLWSIVDDLLVTFIESKDKNRYLRCLPFGNADAAKVTSVMIKCLDYCKQWNLQYSRRPQRPCIKFINQAQLNFLNSSILFRKHFYYKLVPGIEFHYSIENVVTLAGGDYQYIRRKRNKFKRSYPNAVIRPYESKDYEKVMKLNNAWNRLAGRKYASIIDHDYFNKIVVNHDKLSQITLVCELNDQIVGITSGGISLNGESWCSLRKTISEEYDGLSEYLFLSLAGKIHELHPSITLLNDGSDLGSSGLNYFKEKLRPTFKFKRYRLYKKRTGTKRRKP